MNVVRLEGNCLGGGESYLEIRNDDRFALFLHNGAEQGLKIDYCIENIIINDHTVSVGGPQQMRVVEHIFSALYALNIFNVRIDLYGNEIPFFDGSSEEFANAFRELAGDVLPGVRVDRRIAVKEGCSSIVYSPLEADELHVDMTLRHEYIGEQHLALKIDAAEYMKEIAAARTFVFTDEDDPRLQSIPTYGLGITGKNTYSASPLRFADEPVRHKILDLLGDLYVMRQPICGLIRGVNTSHRLNLEFVRKLRTAME
jgi:UDP-3-O-[3-hydroxymyristoyl] N-acetylglucosamine deacetylase